MQFELTTVVVYIYNAGIYTTRFYLLDALCVWAFVEYVIDIKRLSAFDFYCPLSGDDGQFYNFEPACSGVLSWWEPQSWSAKYLTYKSVWTNEVDT